jgi:putative DNA-invertase from lambdoid prophage Rac
MMNPGWPKRIDLGQVDRDLGMPARPVILEKRNRRGCLASHEGRRKCFGPASMPACPPAISRPSRCSCALRDYAAKRGWTVELQVKEIGSGASERQLREQLLAAARRREIDVVLVWRLDRWGRSVTDLLATLQELEHLGVGFVSLTEALDLTTPAGRAMAGLLAVFAEFEREILRERVRAGLAHARQNGKRLGRPVTAGLHAAEVRKLHRGRRQQIRNRPTPANRPHLGAPHFAVALFL